MHLRIYASPLRGFMFPVAILAGGLATRLRPATEKIPKSLLSVAGEPFISWQLKLLKKNGIERVVICAGYLGEQIKDFVKDGADFGLEVSYSFDGDKLLGTGGALKKALPKLGDKFFTIYGDSYLTADFKAVGDAFIKSGKNALMTVYKNNGQYDKSNVVFKNGQLIAYSKKDKLPDMNYIDYGLGCFKTKLFAEKKEEVFDMADIYSEQVELGNVLGYEVFERFYEIGSFEGLDELGKIIKVKTGK